MAELIALFGGTFDPVHNGHLIVARSVAEQCGVERITLVPTARPPHKDTTHASAEHRLAMLRLAIEGEEVFEISEIELARDGPSYTLETLSELHRVYGADTELAWVIGADMLEDLGQWYGADELLRTARIIVAARPPWNRRMPQVFERLRGRFSAAAVGRLERAVVETPLMDISSTIIRERVSSGLSIRFLTPESVCKYIEKHGLYAG